MHFGAPNGPGVSSDAGNQIPILSHQLRHFEEPLQSDHGSRPHLRPAYYLLYRDNGPLQIIIIFRVVLLVL